MAERPDLAREAIRFALGAGVVVAFWIGLVWEEAGRQYLRTTVVTAVACGLLAQLRGQRVRSTAESAAPYVLGAVGLVPTWDHGARNPAGRADAIQARASRRRSRTA